MARYSLDRRERERPLMPVSAWSAQFVAAVQGRLPEFMRSDIEKSTARTYDYGVQRYQAFCRAAGAACGPDPGQIKLFIAALVQANYKLSTIAVTMSGLRRWASEEWGVANVLEDQGIQRALKVARKLAVQDVRQKLPLSARDLRRVIETIAQDQPGGLYVAARDAAMFTIGWAGMLRSSEIVGLEWQDVHFTRGGEVLLFLPKTRTDPGAGSWVLLASAEDAKVHPAKTLQALKLLAGGNGASGPVFCTSMHSGEALKKTTIAPRLKKALERAGVPGAHMYAAHSLRRGGATHAARVGVPLRFIKLMGRWKSDAVREYLYASPEMVLQHSASMLV